MADYFIVRVNVTDPAAYEAYKQLARDAIARYGGRYLVRGGAATVLEGGGEPGRIVVLEFPSLAQARRFYDSPEYVAARQARAGAAVMHVTLVEGV